MYTVTTTAPDKFDWLDKTIQVFEDEKPRHIACHTVYILKCGHIFIDYRGQSSKAVVSHRSSCSRRGKDQLTQSIVASATIINDRTLSTIAKRHLSTKDCDILRSLGYSI